MNKDSVAMGKYLFLLIILVSCNITTTDNESPRYKIYSGNYERVVYRVENNKIYSNYYEILYRIEGNKIYSRDYKLVYKIDGNKIYQGYDVIYRIEHDKVYSGNYGIEVMYRIVEY